MGSVRTRTDPRTNTGSKLEIDPNRHPRGTRRLRRGKAVPCLGDVRVEVSEIHHELAVLLVKTDRRIDEKRENNCESKKLGQKHNCIQIVRLGVV